MATVTVSKVPVGVNVLSLGFNLTYSSMAHWCSRRPEVFQLAKNVNAKIFRFVDGLSATFLPRIMPCTYFDEATKTGTYDWTVVDQIVGDMFAIDAEPLVCLGGGMPFKAPPGMAIDPNTSLPNPESYASYCAEWAKHFKAIGWNVKFYEIFNEPWVYFGQWPVDYVKLTNYMNLFGACRTAMKQVNPEVIVSFDFIHKKPQLDYWLTNNGPDVDSLNFHKYDDWMMPPQYTDEQMLNAAEKLQDWYSIVEAEQVWYGRRGKHLPMLNTETGFNGAAPTTDLRIQTMVGATWLALLLRAEILSGISYHAHFELCSSWYADSWGFGIVNSTSAPPYKPWYPYHAYWMIGANLAVGDKLLETSSSSNNVRVLAWVHEETLNILLINKTTGLEEVNLLGLTRALSYFKIDDTYPYTNPQVQQGTVDTTQPILMNGYTVMLLQQHIPKKYVFRQWQDGDTNPTKTINV